MVMCGNNYKWQRKNRNGIGKNITTKGTKNAQRKNKYGFEKFG